jgi:hypothetical protein
LPVPSFSETFLDALKLGTQARGLRAFVPWLFAVCVGIPTWLAPKAFAIAHMQETGASLAPIFAAFLVAGGFLGAVSINVMSQTVSIVAEPKFARYLEDIKAFDLFIFWPQLTLGIQVVSLIASLTALVISFLAGSSSLTAYATGAALGLLAYSFLKAWKLVDLVRQLAWHRRDYMMKLEDEIERLRAKNGPSGVMPLRHGS